MALAIDAQENEGRFPCNAGGSAGAWLLRGTLLSVSSKNPNAPQDSLYHFRTEDLACCPMATKSLPPDSATTSSSGSGRATFDLGPMAVSGIPGSASPAWVIVKSGPPFVGSYGVNEWLFRVGGFGPLVAVHGRLLGVDLFSLKGKSNIPVALDSVAPSGRLLGGPPLTERSVGSNAFCLNRHDGSVNALFLDWSVRRVGLKELWTLKWSKDFDTNGRWTKARGVKPEDWPKWMRKFKDY